MTMRERIDPAPSRRSFVKTGAAIGAAAALTSILPAAAAAMEPPSTYFASPDVVRPALFRAAMQALHFHGSRFTYRDRIAIADFNQPSSSARFYFVDLLNGATVSMPVTHGRGSDPEHTGWLQSFSNEPGSFSSSNGAFLASDYYEGKHGLSQRLVGLDPTNSNALDRAIVIHPAWYASHEVLRTNGQLGRSEGCFAVDQGDLQQAFALLGPGRMLYSAKV